MKKVDVIKTDRLLLREINETDAEDIVKWRSDTDVIKYLKSPHKLTISEHIDWYHNKYMCDYNRFDWIAMEGKKKIGVFGLVLKRNLDYEIEGKSYAEVNYLLVPEARHKGYAREAVKALIQYAGETWNINQVIVEIHKDNKSSINLADKIGFEYLTENGEFVMYKMSNIAIGG